MLSLRDVVDVPPIAALLAAWLAPKDAVALVVYAVENELHDAASQWITQCGEAHDDGWDRLVWCAAASGSRAALTRLRSCGSIANYVAMREVPSVAPDGGDRLPASVVYEAAKRGDLPTLRWLCQLSSFKRHEAMAYAAANGYLEVALWIKRASVAVGEVEGHHVEVDGVVRALTWTAREEGGQFISYFATMALGLAPIQHGTDGFYVGTMDIVAEVGDVRLLSAMHDDPDFSWSCTSLAMDTAASHGHVHVLEWLLHHQPEGCTQAAVDGAARHGHLNVLQWLFAHDMLDVTLSASTLLAALEGGQIQVLNWMHSHTPDLWSLSPTLARYRLVEAACVSPSRKRVLQWLEDTKDIRLATQAAMSFVLSQGDVGTAQWLADPTGDGALLIQWDWVVAKWMSYEFALWHSDTFDKAALNGHLHILEWLAHAGPFHKVEADTLWQCAMRGHLDVVAFVLERPQHHAKDLVFLPNVWSSFYDAVEDDQRYREHSICEWDKMTCDPTWARQYVSLWLQHRPRDCKRTPWLVEWTKHCGHRELTMQLSDEI